MFKVWFNGLFSFLSCVLHCIHLVSPFIFGGLGKKFKDWPEEKKHPTYFCEILILRNSSKLFQNGLHHKTKSIDIEILGGYIHKVASLVYCLILESSSTS